MHGLHSPYTEKISISPSVKEKMLGPAWQLNTEMVVFVISVAANVRVVLLLALSISVSTDKIIPGNKRMSSSFSSCILLTSQTTTGWSAAHTTVIMESKAAFTFDGYSVNTGGGGEKQSIQIHY